MPAAARTGAHKIGSPLGLSYAVITVSSSMADMDGQWHRVQRRFDAGRQPPATQSKAIRFEIAALRSSQRGVVSWRGWLRHCPGERPNRVRKKRIKAVGDEYPSRSAMAWVGMLVSRR